VRAPHSGLAAAGRRCRGSPSRLIAAKSMESVAEKAQPVCYSQRAEISRQNQAFLAKMERILIAPGQVMH
jgi:hypothetical protein